MLKTCVLVNCRKAQPAFVPLVSAEDLLESYIPEAMSGITEEREVGVGSPSAMDENVDVNTTKDAVAEDNPKVGRTERVTHHRRGRSFFCSKEHKGSRARSLGHLRVFKCRESLTGGTNHSGTNGVSSLRTPTRRK